MYTVVMTVLSVNGYVAFYIPNIDDEIPNPKLGKNVIAPLWTDLDINKGGTWTYEQATNGSLLNAATQIMDIFYPNLNFSASWVFACAWWNVPAESTLGNATFQFGLISDVNNRSFMVMWYGRVPFIASPYWLAGYDVENSDFVTIPVNNSSQLPSTGNVNIPGYWVFPVPASPTAPCENLSCTWDEVCTQINGVYGCGCSSVSIPMAVQVLGSVVNKELSTGGNYQITMVPYPNSMFQKPYNSNVTLGVNQTLYIAVQVDQFNESKIALVMDRCWATPLNQTDYNIYWDLIVNECPNPADGTVEVLQNGVATSSHFSFKMFMFTGFPNNHIYLHCKVHLCLVESGKCAL
ncbi:pancreatic secretory granule membrane major glycoprotein GP2-like isoform X1, partial [Clarias magur]